MILKAMKAHESDSVFHRAAGNALATLTDVEGEQPDLAKSSGVDMLLATLSVAKDAQAALRTLKALLRLVQLRDGKVAVAANNLGIKVPLQIVIAHEANLEIQQAGMSIFGHLATEAECCGMLADQTLSAFVLPTMARFPTDVR